MSKKVIIVDDAVFMRTILRQYLENAGYIVLADLENGKKAVELYRQTYKTDQQADLIIMDITMPEMDGITALKELKKINDSVAVVMCSSMTAQHNVVDAIKTGARHFIGKPFIKENVLEIVRKILGES
jgi:two-component system chemotaxis response regulator CheY